MQLLETLLSPRTLSVKVYSIICLGLLIGLVSLGICIGLICVGFLIGVICLGFIIGLVFFGFFIAVILFGFVIGLGTGLVAGMYSNTLGDLSTSLKLAGEGTEEEHVASSGLWPEEEEWAGKGAEAEAGAGARYLANFQSVGLASVSVGLNVTRVMVNWTVMPWIGKFSTFRSNEE